MAFLTAVCTFCRFILITQIYLFQYVDSAVARIFQRGGGGSHCVKHDRHGVFTTEYYRLFLKKGLQRGGGWWGHGHPRNPLATPLVDTFISSVYIRSPMDFGVRK